MMVDDVLAFVRAALPAPPARVLEIGAGRGELARALTAAGYTVVAIDPASSETDVAAVALDQLDAEPESFDAAVAVVSLHHVESLEVSCRRLTEVLRPEGLLVVDEFDIDRFDERAAGWWIAQRRASGFEVDKSAAEIVAEHRSHLHGLGKLLAALALGFSLGEPVRGAYLYRWELHPALRMVEESEIAQGRLPAMGARLVATRRLTGSRA